MIENYEEFTEKQIEILKQFVTSTDSNIFVLRNLPEVIKGALFSRYSRSTLGLRSLLLKDFILNEETNFDHIAAAPSDHDDQMMAIQKAQNFYDRILDGYGDDSIGELGGAHLAVENVSMLAAKEIEDGRIGGSPLEKSTRYIYFDQKMNGEFMYYREPVLMTSAFRDLYTQTCDRLYEAYGELIPPLTEMIEKTFPKAHDVSKVAYTAALRAKVLDCLRGLLPASALTNMGVFGNGRFFEALIKKSQCHNLSEMQDIGKKSFSELSKVIPSFVRRSDPNHKNQIDHVDFVEAFSSDVVDAVAEHCPSIGQMEKAGVKLIHCDADGPVNVAAAMLFEKSNCSLASLRKYCAELPEEELSKILEIAAVHRKNRRHKSPRALEHATFTFEISADYGIYRDLQRHRILTQEKQKLTCDYGYYTPRDIEGTELEPKYHEAMALAKKAYDLIAGEFPEEAQYVVPMAYNIKWYFHLNLRALQWICELRSAPAGHPGYRFVAQEMARQACEAMPEFERMFKFVDYEGHDLGRLGQEIRKEAKTKAKQEV
ncbi:MAG: FAD-dependent thymidylate synthase [Simkaniaceae bacterium]|nr:FAD-dependent thymidylate synthase [Simkaniaceae bacterium]